MKLMIMMITTQKLMKAFTHRCRMKEEIRLKLSNELTKVHKRHIELGATEKELKHFNNLIEQIEDYKDEEISLGELF